MLRFTAVLILACVFSLPTFARTYAEQEGSVDTEVRRDHNFSLNQETELEMSLFCKLNGKGGGHLRVYVYYLTASGRWRQINHLRVICRQDTPEQSGKFKLPAGRYVVTVSVRQVDYAFKLKDAENQ